MFNILSEPIFSVELGAEGGVVQVVSLTLPELFIELQAGNVREFVRLRAYQRHALHTFLAQLGAIVQHAHGKMPGTTEEWRAAIRSLTPQFKADEPWHLVGCSHDVPAFLQAPADDVKSWKHLVASPDGIDVLITANVHTLKKSIIQGDSIEFWLLALISSQTMHGAMGKGNLGISRMNGGYGSRCGVTVMHGKNIGRSIFRDIQVLSTVRNEVVAKYNYQSRDGLALVWLRPWDGVEQISPAELDPFYIEISRRVRLELQDGGVVARRTGSKNTRLVATAGGLTGDPWMPVVEGDDKSGPTVMSMVASSFGYAGITRILTGNQGRIIPAVTQKIYPFDMDEGLEFVASGVVRGQGKTGGFHERRVKISKVLRRYFETPTDGFSARAEEMTSDASRAERILRSSLFALFHHGTGDIRFDDVSSKARSSTYLQRLISYIDFGFFDALSRETEASEQSEDAASAVRLEWTKGLLAEAENILSDACQNGAVGEVARYKSMSRARSIMNGMVNKEFSQIAKQESAVG